MAADLINLRQARKAKARNAKEQQAQENRVLHGRTKAERAAQGKMSDKATSHLDGHKRDT